jgi:hypothetical protein
MLKYLDKTNESQENVRISSLPEILCTFEYILFPPLYFYPTSSARALDIGVTWYNYFQRAGKREDSARFSNWLISFLLLREVAPQCVLPRTERDVSTGSSGPVPVA